MSRYHRENPDQPIQHDCFEGVQHVHVDPAAGKDWTARKLEVQARYVVKGVDSNGKQWITREFIWPSCDSPEHRKYLRLKCKRTAERMNQSGATVTVAYQELDQNRLWKDAKETA